MPKTTPLELLAPARDADTAIQALLHGADAIYIGAPAFGARAAATNSLDDIKRVVDFAHPYGAKVYVTLNTIIYEHELEAAAQLVQQLYDIGVDALIVQDMALLRMQLPPIALHASTQCDTRTPAKARFLQEVGFSQIVLARELSLDEIRAIRQQTRVPLEGFVHGALCVSYSGDCHAGAVTMGRSANRGECPQICRLRYAVTDQQGNTVAPDGHWLSLRDLKRIDSLADMAEAGISSFKIEGRLKDANYVKHVVGAYSQALDRLVAEHPDRYRRASYGRVQLNFTPDLNRAFNRGFTDYFLATPGTAQRMASTLTPKWLGTPIATVANQQRAAAAPNQQRAAAAPNQQRAAVSVGAVPPATAGRQPSKQLRIKPAPGAQLANGDGIVWFDADNRLQGARINRADGNTLHLAEAAAIPPGTTLYRNHDRIAQAQTQAATATRLIDLHMRLQAAAQRLLLTIHDTRGTRVTASMDIEPKAADKPQLEQRRRTLDRLGGSIYTLGSLDDQLPDSLFIPASQLTALRRQAIELLDSTYAMSQRPDRRLSENTAYPYGTEYLDYHANVANSLARQFYADHGVKHAAPAIELTTCLKPGAAGTSQQRAAVPVGALPPGAAGTSQQRAAVPVGALPPGAAGTSQHTTGPLQRQVQDPTVVMTTRYCMRRELGQCLKHGGKGGDWTLSSLDHPGLKLRLHFDCHRCGMTVTRQ